MTTASWSSVVDHTSDAAFRTWGAEIGINMVGLVQTADTGQINWVTVTRPGVNTAAGYEIWRFADSTLFLKIEYGTGSGAAVPQMWITVGSGSNGSGTLTGQLSTRNIYTLQAGLASTITAYTSRLCAVANSFSISWKETAGAATTNGGFLVIGKTVDGSGGAITTGFGVARQSNTNSLSFQSVRLTATATTFNDVTTNTVVPGDPNTSSTASTGFSQAYQMPMNVPDVLPFNWMCHVLLTEAARGSSFLVAMVGASTHTYYSPGQISGSAYGPYTTGRYCPAMIFE